MKNAQTLFDAEMAYDQLIADPVEQLIASIGTVTLEKKDLIDQARTAYDALTDAQKALVKDYTRSGSSDHHVPESPGSPDGGGSH